jgi:L-aminopeptidase/D-esterase-like protein
VISNDLIDLEPYVPAGGPELTFEFAGLEIGVAEYAEGPTGCTVFHFPEPAAIATDIRGGHPGTLGDHERVSAVCLAGGSLYGLEAATGVAAEILKRRDYAVFPEPARVVGAIIFDYGPRGNTVYPDKELGRAALAAARPGVFPLGRRGAGCSATVGKTFGREGAEPGGQGGAFRDLGRAKVAAFTVVNSVGAIVDRDGRVVLGHRLPSGDRVAAGAGFEDRLAAGLPLRPELTENTTLTVVVTNQRLDVLALDQLARHVHSSMSRAIQPFHTLADGDVLYALTTAEVEQQSLDPIGLALAAGEVAWDAVLSLVKGA